MSASSSSSTNNNNINNKFNRKNSESHASVSDLQGHRLSSYASSSLYPTQPQSLSPKLINSNLDSTSLLSINRFLEETSRSSTSLAKNVQEGSGQLNNLNNPSEPKLHNIGTSPIRYNMSSPSFSQQQNISSPKAINDKPPRRRSSSSPRKRSVSTRNAATSPNLDWRKISANDIRFPSKNGESRKENKKPNKPLRTTRSLSPRPPVRHQHAIMVSDENDIISVKISPSEDTDRNSLSTGTGAVKKKIKSKSEHNSPNFYDNDSKFSYEAKVSITNKSTGCLVYVPTDPWMKMSDLENRNFNKNDPWVSRPGLKKNFGSKSFSNTKFDFSEKAINSLNRPKLCRSKSPLHIDEDLPLSPSSPFLSPPPPPPITPPSFKNNNSLSPIRNSFLDVSPNNVNMLQARHSFSSILQKDDELQLNIRRLSEQIKRKDSKPTGGSGNIYTGASSGADFTEYLQQFHSSEARKAKEEEISSQTATNIKSASSRNLDSVLETTC
ncbi:hypothetical protein ACFFRR_007263 [Megaselia abdita]